MLRISGAAPGFYLRQDSQADTYSHVGLYLGVVLVGDALVGAGERLPRQLVSPVVRQPQRVQPRQCLPNPANSG
jgi:hypothetical protein